MVALRPKCRKRMSALELGAAVRRKLHQGTVWADRGLLFILGASRDFDDEGLGKLSKEQGIGTRALLVNLDKSWIVSGIAYTKPFWLLWAEDAHLVHFA